MSVTLAPGRVNLIGDHTDYNRGLVLPMAIDRWCEVTAAPLDEPVVRATSSQLEGTVVVRLDARFDPRTVQPAWGRFVAGAVAALRSIDVHVGGVELTVVSSVPVGAGLASSAALSVALTLALAPEHHTALVARAELARDAEVHATGVAVGLMDQLATLAGRAGHAILIDFDGITIEPVPLPEDLAVIVVHCGTTRTLAESEYTSRRTECEAIATSLGLGSLREATLEQVADAPRARHVVTENARVAAAVAALRAGDHARVGELMLASHASLRDDYEVSIPELDTLVDALCGAGAWGARLTGAGFGGCVVAVADAARAEQVLGDATLAYRAATGIDPDGFVARAVDGALPDAAATSDRAAPTSSPRTPRR